MPTAPHAFGPVGLQWVLRLRLGLALLLGLAVGLAHATLDVPFNYPVLYGLVVIALLTCLPLSMARRQTPKKAERLVGAALVFDAIWLTVLLMLSGGPTNPFTVLYLVQVAVAAVCLSGGWTWTLALLTCAGFGSLFFLTSERLVHALHHGPGFFAHMRGMWISYSAAAIAVAYFVAKVARALESRERELASVAKRTEQLASLTTLAAGAAHELGTPLNTIALVASDLLRVCAEKYPELHADATLLQDEVQRCRTILQNMSGHITSLPQAVAEDVALEVLGEMVRASLPHARQNRLVVSVRGLATFRMVRDALASALTQMVRNAFDAVDAQSAGTAQRDVVQLELVASPTAIRCIVHDEGPAIPADVLERIGQPFFTTKAPGQGLGLGMFLAFTIANRLSAQLSLVSVAGEGTTATFDMPRPL